MTIRNKILRYFSISIIPLLGICLLTVYLVFKGYRKEEFRQRQKEKITSTLTYLSAFSEMDSEMLKSFNRTVIDSMLNEKLLIFDAKKELVYRSLDDTQVISLEKILGRLSPNSREIGLTEGDYDVVGLYLESGGNAYYGIYKSFDEFGYTKLYFLRNILIGTFLAISVLLLVVTFFLSKHIAAPIRHVALAIQQYKIGAKRFRLDLNGKSSEVDALVNKFNELLDRIDLAFMFQKNATHHISHELKTPLAVLVSNFEKMERMEDNKELRDLLVKQKHMTMGISEVINVLLEISKKDTGTGLEEKELRVDELIFDLCDELSAIYPDFMFSVDFGSGIEDPKKLLFLGSESLLRAALSNLLTNCIRYGHSGMANVLIKTKSEQLCIQFTNRGETLSKKEVKSMFKPYFRGHNSKGILGNGLGLALVKKIMEVYDGDIVYTTPDKDVNKFTMLLPLR
ncbi:HAMP domain-containing histidine kinase [Echinicola soli]|uniref:histidine kinase n=1 Tax=Echinicola soli TaxID=2591634 RepID=A0A514CJ59_9BACT|nr:HAMP domain-containing sensor histidine kinase [Echinicola soli]QDH79862.1 HAMP domain-containing histidine kinase [Echinicola soli]